MTPPAPSAVENVTLRDGTELFVRSILPGDREALDHAFHRLSPESRYRRFFAPRTNLTAGDLAYLTEIDHRDHEALVAITTDLLRRSPAIDPRSGEIVGVARYVRTEDDIAEASVVVADDWQHRGIGSALLDRLARRAREAGIAHFVALVLSDNRGAIQLFEQFAPDPERRRHEGYVELMLELPEPEEMSGSPLARALREVASGVATMIARYNRPGR